MTLLVWLRFNKGICLLENLRCKNQHLCLSNLYMEPGYSVMAANIRYEHLSKVIPHPHILSLPPDQLICVSNLIYPNEACTDIVQTYTNLKEI